MPKAKSTATNVLIRGADGRLYSISAEDMEKYVVPTEQAEEIEAKLHLADQGLVSFAAGEEDSASAVSLSAGFTTAGFTGAGFTKGGFTKAGFTKGREVLFANFGFISRKKK